MNARKRRPLPPAPPKLLLASLIALALPTVPAAAQPPEILCDGELAASDAAAGDLFACALALDGPTAVIGSLLDDDRGEDSGSVYVFEGAGGAFAETAKLLASDGRAGDQLGFSVAFDGGRIAAGSPFHDAAGRDAGAAYVFRREETGWVEEAKLTPAGLGPFDQLGQSVAVAGDAAAAGAPGDDGGGDAAGAVYVFERGEGGWAQAAKLTASDGAAGDGFGFALALDGSTLLVGAPFEGGAAGAVYVFERTGGGWAQAAKLTAGDRAPASLFGTSVALDGDAAAVGARLDDRAGDDAGAAYVFRRTQDGGWAQEARLEVPGLGAADELGVSVALEGDRLAAGARFGDTGVADSGTAYLFRRGEAGWVAESRLAAPVPRAADELGFAVALSGGTVLAGAYRDDGAGPDAGNACVVRFGAGPEPPAGREADLGITKTDGRETVEPGGTLTYTIRATNAGPEDVTGAAVTDGFPLAGCTWSCTPAAGARCETREVSGDLEDTVDLPAGTSATYRATCPVPEDAEETVLRNTARITAPAEVTDPDPRNNRAVDETRVERVAPPQEPELRITKTDGQETAVPGTQVTYLVTASNGGTGAAESPRVTDPFPVAGCTWTCAGMGGGACTAGGSGDIADPVGLPAGGAVTYTAVCALDPSATGELVNTATVGADNAEPVSATDLTTLTPRADVAVEVTGVALGGSSLTATVAVVNGGPSTARGVELTVLTPEGLTFLSATGPCADGFPCPLGELLPGGEVELEVVFGFTPDCAAPEPREVEILAAVEGATPDPELSNNSDGATATLPAPVCAADLRITKTAFQTSAVGGQPLTYSLRVTNAGPDAAAGAVVTDLFPAGLLGVSWTCTPSPGAVCQAGGSGAVIDSVILPPGGSVTYFATGTAAPGVCGRLTNTATVAPPEGVTDPRPLDNRAVLTLDAFPAAGLCAVKTVDSKVKTVSSPVLYQVLLVNGGPGGLQDGPGAEFVDPIPLELELLSAAADGGTVAALNNQVRWDGAIAARQIVTLTIQALVNLETEGQEICNQGTLVAVNPPVLTDDPTEPGQQDPTCFRVASSVVEVPALAPPLLVVLALLLAAAGLRRLRHGR